jgi:hypothetical protein
LAEVIWFKTAETTNRIVGLYSLRDPGQVEKGIYYFDVDRNARIDDVILVDFIKDTSTLILDPADFGNNKVEQIFIDTFNDVISMAVIVINPAGATVNQRDLYLGYIKNRRLEKCTASFPFTYPDQIGDFQTRFFNDGIALRIFKVIGIDYPVTIGSH